MVFDEKTGANKTVEQVSSAQKTPQGYFKTYVKGRSILISSLLPN